MSAITGIFYRNGRTVDSKLIKRMNDKLSHRGPDGSKVWCEGSIALGHQMLHTTQESLHEILPFEEENLIITADARIDNRKDLSQKLGIKNIEEVSDSYFILKAYQKWDEKCPEKLLGDFAFVIWDKNSEKLFAARDHMGVKPFYYYLSDEEFFFATEIKALFKLPEVPHCLNEQKVAFYLMDIDDNKSTFYKDINSFSAAHTMTIHQNNVEIKKYWTLDPESQIIMDSEEEYANKFREIFTEAVKCRLRTAYPIGFELSGGLDSSSIVSIAKKLLNKNGNSCSTNINTFSYIFEHFPVSDESYYIKKVTDTGGIEPQFIYGDKINPLKNMETILWYQEQPFFTPFLEMIYQLYDKMQENDTRIMLSGLGGDAVAYYGVNYLRDLAVNFKWKKLMNELKDYSKNVNIDYLNLFYYTVIIPLIPEIIKRPILVFKKSKLDILNKEFAKRINAKKYLKNLYQDPLKEAKTAKKLHYHILSTDNIYMSEMLDRTNSAFSIEPRYPFLDKRLVEFCYAIPSGMKFKNGWGRYIQRIAMTDILPKENQWRPFKAELTPVLEKNLLLYEKTFLNNLICHNNTKIEKYVDQNTIKNIYQKFINGIAGYDSYKIWFASLLFLWLQKNEF